MSELTFAATHLKKKSKSGTRENLSLCSQRKGLTCQMKTNQLVLALLLAGAMAVKLPAQTLVSFNGTNGANPYAALVLGNDGNFYGTTLYGGITNSQFPNGMGTVFQVTTNGTLATLVSFNATNGANPHASLTLGNDGNFYGTTGEGGSKGYGTVFTLTTNGTLTTLVSFASTNGANPQAALTLGNDGNFYGTSWAGGSSNDGTVFKVATNGTFTMLVSFAFTNGANPQAALTLGSDGNFYGTTTAGTILGAPIGTGGTIFKMKTNGTLTKLVSFNGNIGANPRDTLTLGNDGNFYGTTLEGTTNVGAPIGSGEGTIFKVTTNGALTILVLFASTNGANPWAALTLGNDGNFYGTTTGGGSGNGTVFQVTTNGTLNTIVSFNGTDGANPVAALTLGNDGNFYGTTAGGGSSGYGTVFRLSFAPSISAQPSGQTNYAGSSVTFLISATSLSPLSYQWQKNGTNLVDGGNISGSVTNSFAITDISDRDAATYSVIVSNSSGITISSNATLTVNDFPFIATQPMSQSIGVGSNVTFTAAAYGAPPFIFQWYFGNSPVGSPTSGTSVSTFTLSNVQTNQSGNYSVLLINGYDSIMSSNAVLTVTVSPPSIGTQPASQRVMIGSSVSFNVSVVGTTPFCYQWYFNSTNILNATNASYAIQVVGTNNAGNYSVVITNSAGSVTSSNAILTVIVPPTVALQFLAGYPLLNLNGMLSNNFVVQYSTNLANSNWINLLSVTNLSSSPYQFLDPTGVGQPARFYRAIQQ